MTGNKLRAVIIVAVLSSAAWRATPATADGLPTLLSILFGTTPAAYRVRPRVIQLDQAEGGELKLHWSSWTSTQATGSGTGEYFVTDAIGHYRVVVHASEPRHRRFTVLKLIRTEGGRTYQEKLVLGSSIVGPSWTEQDDGS